MKSIMTLVLIAMLAGCSGKQFVWRRTDAQVRQQASADWARYQEGQQREQREKEAKEKAEKEEWERTRERYSQQRTWAEKDAYARRMFKCVPLLHRDDGSMVCARYGVMALTNMNGAMLASAYLMDLPESDASMGSYQFVVNCANGLSQFGGVDGIPGGGVPLGIVKAMCQHAYDPDQEIIHPEMPRPYDKRALR